MASDKQQAVNLPENPFVVQTPEGISAQNAVSLFVEEFADFYQILREGHTFLNGARGSGKSMIFRFMEPDCQTLKHGCHTRSLPYFSFYIPIKETELKLTELTRLRDHHGNLLLNEHLLTLNVAIKAFSSLSKINLDDEFGTNATELKAFIQGPVVKLLRRGGWSGELPSLEALATVTDLRETLVDILDGIYAAATSYLKTLSFSTNPSYDGALFGYLDFLRPLLIELRALSFMPKAPIFLLIDDADNLNIEQTKILNTWISSRGSAEVTLKVSTQRRYKTYRTVAEQRIEAPHDYVEVDISDIYTSNKDRYADRISKIVQRRLSLSGTAVTPECKAGITPDMFFPPDQDQEEKIEKIKQKIISEWEATGRGNRARDDAYRYARPTYIAQLRGPAKSASTYSYAGFHQLVHVSSGVVRYFLEPAALMFGEQKAQNEGRPVDSIRPHIQTKVVREEANKFFFSEFDKLLQDQDKDADEKTRVAQLQNLIASLGELFQKILLSTQSERRVFSVALSDRPDADVSAVFNLGVEYGYFHKSSIGKKDGFGRTALFVLSRRLAPLYTLDPTSFAGYKFITNEIAREMIFAPRRFHTRLQNETIELITDPPQADLLEDIR